MLYQLLLLLFIYNALGQGPTGPIGPTRPPPGFCHAPREEPIAEIKDGGLKGRYPKGEISKASSSMKGSIAVAKSDSSLCGCYRPGRKPKSTEPTKDLTGPAGPVGPPHPPPPPPPPGIFYDSCSSVNEVFSFPSSELYLGDQCWILKPWANLNCPYRRCKNSGSKCEGVRAMISSPFQPGIAECRNSNYRYITYYIWCPKRNWIYPRYVRIPMCCSCMFLSCRHIGKK